MDFGEALRALSSGKHVARSGWNGKGMWIRRIDIYGDAEFRVKEIEPCTGTWAPFLVMRTVDNMLVPWLASQTDVLAKDWSIVE